MQDEKHAIIATIEEGSLAQQQGLKAGETILSVNGQEVQDLIDLNFAMADEQVHLVVNGADGPRDCYFQKRFGDDIGITMESAVFDHIRQCHNNCIFCFIAQMPEGMRPSLYVKDDDYRMSFLTGSFITLSNMTEEDVKRICQYHLSPLHISVHTTNGALRKRMMSQEKTDHIMEQLQLLADYDIDMYCQIVLVPGYNDGAEFERTLKDLQRLQPNVLGIAVVPLGMTKFRDNCCQLMPVSVGCARETIDIAKAFQQQSRDQYGRTFVYLADEFYLKAGYELPDHDSYDGYEQIEDGVGMLRLFEQQWHHWQGEGRTAYEQPLRLALFTGTLAAPFIEGLVREVEVENLSLTVIPVTNDYFGDQITVAGLLTAQDILAALKESGGHWDGIIIPGTALRKGEDIFLDDMTLEEFRQAAGVPVRVSEFAGDLKYLLYHWDDKE